MTPTPRRLALLHDAKVADENLPKAWKVKLWFWLITILITAVIIIWAKSLTYKHNPIPSPQVTHITGAALTHHH